MKRYSGIYEIDGWSFRYDYKDCMVELVTKARKEEIADNAEWMAKYGKPLWDIDESGYIVMESAGLMPKNWKDKEARDEYLNEFIFALEEVLEMDVEDLL